MKNLGMLEWVAFILVIVGGINWGLYGLFKLNLVGAIFGEGFIGRILYILIGVSAGFLAYQKFRKQA
jgi:uncharacterized membrane protein YuzA (DUF378 family)